MQRSSNKIMVKLKPVFLAELESKINSGTPKLSSENAVPPSDLPPHCPLDGEMETATRLAVLKQLDMRLREFNSTGRSLSEKLNTLPASLYNSLSHLGIYRRICC